VALLKESNEQAFTEIYRRYWRQVYATAFQFDKDPNTAEDIVQQVFLSLFEKRSSLEHISSISAYLASAAKYKILDHCATKKRRSVLLNNYYQDQANTEINLTDDQLHTRILEEFLSQKTNELPDRTRIIFLQSRHQLLSNQQIASKMNISVKTVEKHITSAIKSLRFSLNQFTNGLFSIVIIFLAYTL
jgi:RNA polymerase sigma-70 factor (family 1)